MSTSASSTPPHQFLNCEMEYECPKNWFELTETDKAGIKHCSTCDKHVHLCITQDELDSFAHQGVCIAFFSDPDLATRFKLSRERVETHLRLFSKDRIIHLFMIPLKLERFTSSPNFPRKLLFYTENTQKSSEINKLFLYQNNSKFLFVI